VFSLDDIGIFEEIPETGTTLSQNACIKAKEAFSICGLNVFSDDTGLEVEALNGAPGVYSARYAGPAKLAKDNMDKLLAELKDKQNRKARFVTVICLIYEGREFLFEGELRGEIGHSLKGDNGFGYDPVFIPENQSKTLAELSSEEKNKISHRAKAIEALKAFLVKNCL